MQGATGFSCQYSPLGYRSAVTMGKVLKRLADNHVAFMERQHMFFAATAGTACP